MLAKLISLLRYVVGAVGLFFAILLCSRGQVPEGVAIVSLTTVGFVGIISFISHSILHKQDAKIVKLKAVNDDFQIEVGFANLALGVTAVVAFIAKLGIQVDAILVFAFGLYLVQAGILHTYRSLTGKKKDIAHLIRGGLVTFAYCAGMFYVVYLAVTSSQF